MSILDRWTWIRERQRGADRVFSEPQFNGWGTKCIACAEEGIDQTSSTGHEWCPDCALVYGPHAFATYLQARIYENDVERVRAGVMPDSESPLVEDIQTMAIWDELTDGSISKVTGLTETQVMRVRRHFRIPGREGNQRLRNRARGVRKAAKTRQRKRLEASAQKNV